MLPIRASEISLLSYESREISGGEMHSRHTPDAHTPFYIFVDYSERVCQHADISKLLYLGMNKCTYFQKCKIPDHLCIHISNKMHHFISCPYMICNIRPHMSDKKMG